MGDFDTIGVVGDANQILVIVYIILKFYNLNRQDFLTLSRLAKENIRIIISYIVRKKLIEIPMDASIECKLILTGIENLEQCLQRNSASDALEIEDDAETTQKYYSLTRLKKSLIQYSDRTKRLVYVGFMGHFSTGKSSTINSLLSLGEESSQSRRVGQNPIDKHITLITHTENRDSLMSVTKENIVSIRSEFIDHDFLRNIVIADTPGTGDPILAHEIAQDFLPICDLIIYFFNAAVPLDNSDIPLLKEKSSHLPFIPIEPI